MKIIQVDNFNRDDTSNLIAENVSPTYAREITEFLNDKFSGKTSPLFFMVVAEGAKTMIAKLSVVSFEVECPYCLEAVESPYSGSLTWSILDGDIPTGIIAGQEIDCSSCGEKFNLPKLVVNNKLPQRS